MSKTLIKRTALAFFAIYLVAVTWPVADLFGSARPMILGLPLSLAWPIGWILAGWAVLLTIDHLLHKRPDE